MTVRIKSISASGIRTLDDFKLDLDGLMVLIGENGSGKSTIVEVCELLRRLPGQNFWNEFNQIHGGATLLQRKGAGEIKLGVEVDGDGDGAVDRLEIIFGRNGITSETIWKDDTVVLERVGNVMVRGHMVQSTATAFSQPALTDPYAVRLRTALEQIDVQVPFASTAYWLSQSQGGRLAPLRDSVTIAPTNRLERLGINLPNAFYSMKDQHRDTEWNETMDLVRLGLGDWVESISLPADAGGGKIALALKIANRDAQIPAASLSDGQLAYLAFVALARLPTPRSLFVFDEIETHLHPALLARVMSLLATIAERCPVVLTTHSRRLLDGLDDPAKSVGVLDLDQQTLTTKLRRLDAAKLTGWLDHYEGIGQVLDAGYPESLFQTDEGR